MSYAVVEFLETPEEMAAYLEAFIQDADGDALFIATAMRDIAGAKGMTQIARETGLSSERLYKAMSVEKSPHFDTVLKVISALGLTLSASVKGAERAELVLLANLRFADVSNWKRPFEQAPGVDRPPPSLCFATPASLPATQGQR